MAIKLYTSKRWLKRKLDAGMTEEEIAKEANTSQATIHRWIKSFGLK